MKPMIGRSRSGHHPTWCDGPVEAAAPAYGGGVAAGADTATAGAGEGCVIGPVAAGPAGGAVAAAATRTRCGGAF